MKFTAKLPENYKEILYVDLQKNKKLALLVNGLALIISAVMIIIGLIISPLSKLYSEGPVILLINLLIMLIGMPLYLVLHELVHGIFMYSYSRVKPRYGFTGMYAYAGSDGYFSKLPYIIIALAPVVIWGIVLLVLNLTLPSYLFWSVYMIQIANISGAAGDAYVTAKFSRLPTSILVQDTGVALTVYAPEGSEK